MKGVSVEHRAPVCGRRMMHGMMSGRAESPSEKGSDPLRKGQTPSQMGAARKACQSSLLSLFVGLAIPFSSSVSGFAEERPASANDSSAAAFEIRPLTIDANEGIAVADVDGDQRVDVIAGRCWYRNPDWVSRPLRVIEDWNGYVQSNGDYVYDVNRDGRPDVIAGSFIPTQVHWYENPGPEALRLGQMWPQRLLVDTGNSTNEGQLFEDLDGDGTPEWIVNSWSRDVPMVVWRLSEGGEGQAPMKALPHVLGEKANGHGLGAGDLNGDGKVDVLVGQGWYEQPAAGPWSEPWKFHPDWDLQASLPILVKDLDEDGKSDLLFGYGHDYGLFWWQQIEPAADGKLQWKEHLIDRGFSQPHSLLLVDLTGDGKEELVTGKRYYAHNGGDPGGQDAPCLYYYRWDAAQQRFSRFVIEEGRVGTGLQIVTADFDQDGRSDLAVAGKSGTYLLMNRIPRDQ